MKTDVGRGIRDLDQVVRRAKNSIKEQHIFLNNVDAGFSRRTVSQPKR